MGVTVVWVVWVPQPSPVEQGFVNEIPTLPGRCHEVTPPWFGWDRAPKVLAAQECPMSGAQPRPSGVPRGLCGPGKMGVRERSMKKKASVGR